MIHRKVAAFVVLLMMSAAALAQVNDAGLWAGAKFSIDAGKGLDAHIDPEIRMDENISRVNGFFSDLGLSKKINDVFSSSLEYRVGGKVEETWYTFRHRISIGLSAKHEIGKFDFSLTGRIQLTPQITGSNTDLDLRNVRRIKAGIKYNCLKKWTLLTSFELFTEDMRFSLSDWRWQGNIERKITKRNAVSFGYLIQKEIFSRDMDFVFQMAYKTDLSFKKKKKDHKPKTP